MTCIFCDIHDGKAPAAFFDTEAEKAFKTDFGANAWWFAIHPLNPVTPGHILFIPKVHVEDAREDIFQTLNAMDGAIEYANELKGKGIDCNIIMNCGALAGQTVFHLHIHVVPRVAGDGLLMPWDR